MVLRKYENRDLPQIITLFQNTVRIINAKDYSEKQIDAWLSAVDFSGWDESFCVHDTWVALSHTGDIIGFGDIDKSGYLDRLYVHHAFQRQSVARCLCDILEQTAFLQDKQTVYTDSSITAVPFFKSRGYRILQQCTVVRGGETLVRYRMQKEMSEYEKALRK